MSPRKLKDWEVAWGVGFSLVAGMAALVVGASFVDGDVAMSLWYLGIAVVCTLGALVAFTPGTKDRSAPYTEFPYCTGCDDRHDGPRCY